MKTCLEARAFLTAINFKFYTELVYIAKVITVQPFCPDEGKYFAMSF